MSKRAFPNILHRPPTFKCNINHGFEQQRTTSIKPSRHLNGNNSTIQPHTHNHPSSSRLCPWRTKLKHASSHCTSPVISPQHPAVVGGLRPSLTKAYVAAGSTELLVVEYRYSSRSSRRDPYYYGG